MHQHFVIQRPDGSQQKVGGYRFKAPRPDARRYDGGGAPDSLPKKVDLRPHMTEVENQEHTNSCAANAIAGAYEYLVKRHLDEAYDVSRLFIYYNGRYAESETIEDEGMTIEGAIQGLREYGAPSEETWPFDPDMVNEEPSEEAYEEAAQFVVEDAALVPTELDTWKRVLAEGYPIVFGLSLFDSFDAHRKPGLVPMPSRRESGRESHGGHAMLCVGYSDPDQLFIVRNSWGEEWGDAGYCYIPYSYMMDPKYNFGDSWIIRRAEGVEADEGTWADDEESIVEELDSALASMGEEEFQALIDACGDTPLETRIAVIFLQAAGADGDISEEELGEIASYMESVLEALGSRYSAEKVLRQATRRLGDQDLLDETVSVLGEHLSQEALAGIVQHVQEAVESDEASEDEQAFVDSLVEAWQIGS
jgi:hypothetical protein